MATPVWQPGHFYPPGSLVVPRTALPVIPTAVTNPGFETGDDTDWNLGAGMSVTNDAHYAGSYAVQWTGTSGPVYVMHDPVPATPGLQLNASCMYQQGAASSGQNTGRVVVRWLDGGGATIREDLGLLITSGSGGAWKNSSTGNIVGPAGTEEVQIGALSNRTNGNESYADNFNWTYNAATAPVGLVFRATQAAAAFSDVNEPTWPLTVGVPVVDGGVTWEGVLANRVVWQARPIMMSGAVEPDWNAAPISVGDYINDNTVNWRVTTQRVTDPKCPNSKIVIILASKVYAADGDIVPYSATTNPRDWSTLRDAGFLPTNLQTYGANPVAALGAYRSNLLVFNSQGFQMWQVDEDPELSNLLDALPVPCVEHWSYAPVSNDGLFYSPLGVRSVNISAGSTNLAAGDVGLPVDPILNESYAYAKANDVKALGFYFPGAGQYWLSFSYNGVLDVDVEPENPDEPITEEYPFQCIAWIYSITQAGAVGSWSRYLFPFRIDSVTQDGTTLVFRSEDDILEYDRDALVDFLDRDGEHGPQIPFPGLIWWPYLDFGAPGIEKNLIGFDMVATNEGVVSFGFAQDAEMDPLGFTTPYGVMADSIPGDVVPFEMTAPSFSVKITYNNGAPWKFLAMNLYLQNWRS